MLYSRLIENHMVGNVHLWEQMALGSGWCLPPFILPDGEIEHGARGVPRFCPRPSHLPIFVGAAFGSLGSAKELASSKTVQNAGSVFLYSLRRAHSATGSDCGAGRGIGTLATQPNTFGCRAWDASVCGSLLPCCSACDGVPHRFFATQDRAATWTEAGCIRNFLMFSDP